MPEKGEQQAPQQEYFPSLQVVETGDVPDDNDVPDNVHVAGFSRKRTRPSRRDVKHYLLRYEKWLDPAWKEMAQTFSGCSHK